MKPIHEAQKSIESGGVRSALARKVVVAIEENVPGATYTTDEGSWHNRCAHRVFAADGSHVMSIDVSSIYIRAGVESDLDYLAKEMHVALGTEYEVMYERRVWKNGREWHALTLTPHAAKAVRRRMRAAT